VIGQKYFFQKLFHGAPSGMVSGMPYLYYLRQHLGPLMKIYFKLIGWGYGFFSTSSGGTFE